MIFAVVCTKQACSHTLRFGYCTWPYCDFDNISINCSALIQNKTVGCKYCKKIHNHARQHEYKCTVNA